MPTELTDLANKLWELHGIYVPIKPTPEFLYRADNQLNIQPELQSLEEIEKAASNNIPYAGKLAQIMPFYRSVEWVYLGRLWPQDIGEMGDYDPRPLLIPHQTFFYSDGQKILDLNLPASRPEYPFIITERDNFRKAFFHELGHGVDQEIFFRSCNDQEEHTKQVPAQYRTIKDHPIYSTFGPLTGWGFGKGKKWEYNMEKFGVDIGDMWLNPLEEALLNDQFPEAADSKEAFRITMFTRHPFTNSITEVFAEFFSIYLLNPRALTDEEKKYFRNLHSGLINDPEGFMVEVARNPKVLLQ